MRKEFKSTGKKAQFVILNSRHYLNSVHNQTKRCDIPVMQDTASVNAWDAMKGGKEYYYVYDKTGALHAFFKPWGNPSLNLGFGSGGYSKLKSILLGLQ